LPSAYLSKRYPHSTVKAVDAISLIVCHTPAWAKRILQDRMVVKTNFFIDLYILILVALARIVFTRGFFRAFFFFHDKQIYFLIY
jgi:hypothetical protein